MINLERDANDTIVACSSGNLDNTAISLIRISGKNFLQKINDLFSIDLESIEERKAYYCNLFYKELVNDQVVIVLFKGPKSFNGEDILEISVHGNILNVNNIIQCFNESGVRSSYPGEFSYRALKNKKLSLTQVEGLDLLLNANSNYILSQGQSLLGGSLNSDFESLYSSYLHHRSCLEIGFDFLDDVGEELFTKNFNESYEKLKSLIYSLENRINRTDIDILDPKITLFGLPNSGKSTIFNSLLSYDRSIVSHIEGTTRDYVSESIMMKNCRFKLVDTAGIRTTSDIIEEEGVSRAFELFNSSFYKILLVDISKLESLVLLEKLFTENKQVDLVIFTHCKQADFCEKLRTFFGPIEPDSNSKNIGPIGPVSFLKSGSIEPLISSYESGPMGPCLFKNDDLLGAKQYLFYDNDVSLSIYDSISDVVHNKYLKSLENNPVLLNRHKQALQNIAAEFRLYENLITDKVSDVSVLSSELNIVGNCISELVGIVSTDDILNNIFDNFCIGK